MPISRDDVESIRDAKSGDFPPYAWPGGYPIGYYCADGGMLCAACANNGNGSEASTRSDAPDDWRLVGWDVIEEAPEGDIRCDHCNTIIFFAERD